MLDNGIDRCTPDHRELCAARPLTFLLQESGASGVAEPRV